MKIGVVSYPASGYLNPMTALARRLQSRGPEVLCIGVPDTEPIIRAAGLNFISYCDEEFPVRSLGEAYAPVAKMHGLEVVNYTCRMIFSRLGRAALKHLPQKLESSTIRQADEDQPTSHPRLAWMMVNAETSTSHWVLVLRSAPCRWERFSVDDKSRGTRRARKRASTAKIQEGA